MSSDSGESLVINNLKLGWIFKMHGSLVIGSWYSVIVIVSRPSIKWFNLAMIAGFEF